MLIVMDRPTGSSSWDDPIQSKSQAHDDETTAIMDRLGPDGDQLHRKEELVIEPTPIGTTKAHHIQHRPASTFSHSSSFIEETKNNISSRHLSLDSFSTQQHRRSSFSSSSSSLGSDKNNSMILWSDEKDPQDGTSKPKHSHWQADDGVNIKMSGDTYNKESITAEQQKFSASTSSSSSLLFSRERIHAPTVGGPSDAMAQPSGAFVTLTGISPQIQVDLTLPFPIKLHVMLSHPQFENCIEWLPHGRSWRIVDGAKFETDVIHKFFRSGKLTSFMRQVNGWAFVRVVDGPGANSYWHPMFLRGLPCLAYKMKRPPKTKNSAASVRSSHSGGVVSESPDFNRIAQIAPLPASFVFSATGNGIVPVASNQERMGDGSQGGIFPGSATSLGIASARTSAPAAGTAKLSTADVQYLVQQNRLFDQHIFNNAKQDSDKRYGTRN